MNTEPTWMLPGEDGKDYVQVEGVSPIELEPDVWGFIITNVHGNEDFQGGVERPRASRRRPA